MTSILDQLDASIAQQQENRQRRPGSEPIDVDGRPGWAFEYATKLPYEEYASLLSRNQSPELGGTHLVNLGADLAVTLCRGMTLNGERVTDEAGGPVTFGSPLLMSRLGATTATECVRRVYVDAEGEPDEAAVANLGVALQVVTGWAGRSPTRRP